MPAVKFLAPLGFLFAAALPVIVLFYLLKLRRVRHDVPSNLLWKRAAEDLHANAPFQKLRRNLLLLLQLIIAALLVLGLARPFMNLRASHARNTVLLIDNSASMNTRDEAGNSSRLASAKEQAIRHVRSMAPGESAMLTSFSDKAAVLVQFTQDKTALESAIKALPATDLPTQPADALSMVQSLAKPANAEIILFSDGAFPPASVQLSPSTRCKFVKLGTRSRNAGIVALDIRRPPENSKEFQVFATVRNYSDEPLKGRLEVSNSGKLVDAKDIELAPHGDSPQIFSNAQLHDGHVELRLAVEDDLDSDNVAYAVIAPPRKKSLVLVSAGNYFLERMLTQDSSHQFEIIKVSPSQFRVGQKADVFIFDGVMPTDKLPDGNYFIVNARPPIEGFVQNGDEENPPIFDWDQQHPIMRFVELGDVQIRRARKFSLPQASHVLSESRETPLMSIYSAANRNVVLWSFDIYDTNLPLRVAFPILVSNSLDWLLRFASAGESSSQSTGQIIQLDVPSDFRRGSVTDPGRQKWSLVPNAGNRLLFDRTSRVGFYAAEVNDKSMGDVGVSLINAQESDIQPRSNLQFSNGQSLQNTGPELRNREIWKWFAVGALAFLMLEWLIYHRRIWV